MSKMDDMRAMREARYAQSAARAAKPAPAPKRTERPAPPPADPDLPEARLCGHRSISGRTCTREHGHEAKSHRYS